MSKLYSSIAYALPQIYLLISTFTSIFISFVFNFVFDYNFAKNAIRLLPVLLGVGKVYISLNSLPSFLKNRYTGEYYILPI